MLKIQQRYIYKPYKIFYKVLKYLSILQNVTLNMWVRNYLSHHIMIVIKDKPD